MTTSSHIPIHPLLSEALQAAFREINENPHDSIQDIVNEHLMSWKTGLRMDHTFEIVADWRL